MKTVGYIGRVLQDGHLSLAPDARRELGLEPDEEVQVVLIPLPKSLEAAQAQAERHRKRHEAWQAVMSLRESFAGVEFSLTDEIVRMRVEEDV